MKLSITMYRRYQWLLGVTKQNLLWFIGTETISMELLSVHNSKNKSFSTVQNSLSHFSQMPLISTVRLENVSLNTTFGNLNPHHQGA